MELVAIREPSTYHFVYNNLTTVPSGPVEQINCLHIVSCLYQFTIQARCPGQSL